MTDLHTARERFRARMNGTQRDLSTWPIFGASDHGDPDDFIEPSVLPETEDYGHAEDITDPVNGQHGKLHRLPGGKAELFIKARPPGSVMLVVASVLLLALAAAQGYVSYRAQFTFIHSAGKGVTPATLEALGLDAAAAIFAFLALAKARRGKSSPYIERALNIACALGSGFMNVLGADLASPRSIAVYVLPPVLYAATSDRLIAVVTDAYGLTTRSLWAMAGKAAGTVALYSLRLALAPPSTAKGLRLAVLEAAPLPEADDGYDEDLSSWLCSVQVGEDYTCGNVLPCGDHLAIEPPRERVQFCGAETSPGYRCAGIVPCPHHPAIIPPKDQKALPPPKGPRGPRANSKTAQFIARVEEAHGPLASIPLDSVGKVTKELHGDLNEGEARKQLRNRVIAARGEVK